jgi:Na+/H+ antiporter NhaD/arsenite permease-like protein
MIAFAALLLQLVFPVFAFASEAALPQSTDAVSKIVVAAITTWLFVALFRERRPRTLNAMIAAAAIFLVTYLTPYRLLSFENSVLVSVGKDGMNVIMLLLSMMAIIAVLSTSNVFQWATEHLL